jgi:ABC-type antimicrobial peptide transport system permease subunit
VLSWRRDSVATGASRSRLIQQSLVESILLSLGGALLGLGIAWAGVRLLISLSPPNLPRLNTIHMDGTVFGFLVAVAVLIGPGVRRGTGTAHVARGDG